MTTPFFTLLSEYSLTIAHSRKDSDCIGSRRELIHMYSEHESRPDARSNSDLNELVSRVSISGYISMETFQILLHSMREDHRRVAIEPRVISVKWENILA